MKLAVVVQRYGADISGGAELHARYIAERLARHATVEVLTTCARDYVTWRNELAPGVEQVKGVTVRRFLVARPRNTDDFGRRSVVVFERLHSIADEVKWLDSEGPTSLDLVRIQYRDGAVSYLAVLDATRQYQQALIGLIQARAARLADTAALYASLGGSWMSAMPAVASAPHSN